MVGAGLVAVSLTGLQAEKRLKVWMFRKECLSLRHVKAEEAKRQVCQLVDGHSQIYHNGSNNNLNL